MMTFYITIAKLLVAILPFLNKKSDLKGKWKAKYIAFNSKNEREEFAELNQLFTLVWGKITPLDRPEVTEWICYGLYRDPVFSGFYSSTTKLANWQGSFTLSFTPDYRHLEGYYAGFEGGTKEIVNSKYQWEKL